MTRFTPDIRAGLGHNGGPPLDEPAHEWGNGPVGTYFEWKATRIAARKFPADIAIRYARKADSLGLSYDEYVLELLERGRHLQASDISRILEIKARRPIRY
ncbi:hypothetical protein GCM10007989_24740 [Devosia pacifica]|uniref:Uncharacterized protein n=1 Tax=Devosia pacifica TaxID=1335967 RepID=A0A918S9L2_9HYPH|nr:hypothetical protein [Devosia pacifica]GHA27874.1 hypothetical protein GCM10007989_24740 [Devosia pacifica]